MKQLYYIDLKPYLVEKVNIPHGFQCGGCHILTGWKLDNVALSWRCQNCCPNRYFEYNPPIKCHVTNCSCLASGILYFKGDEDDKAQYFPYCTKCAGYRVSCSDYDNKIHFFGGFPGIQKEIRGAHPSQIIIDDPFCPKCECGSEKAGLPFHSDWCPIK